MEKRKKKKANAMQKQKQDLTKKEATAKFIRTATTKYVRSGEAIDDGVLEEIMTTWPELLELVPSTLITQKVALCAVEKDRRCFCHAGPMHSNVSVVISAVRTFRNGVIDRYNHTNWKYVDPDIFMNKEFVWWAIDTGLVDMKDQAHFFRHRFINAWSSKLVAALQVALMCEEGLMCLVAKHCSIPNCVSKSFSIPDDKMLTSAINRVHKCQQPFSLMKEVLKKRVLIAMLFTTQKEIDEIGLAGRVAAYLTIPMVFYAIVNREGGDPRYRGFRRKN